MKLKLLLMGKTSSPEIKTITADYYSRIHRFVKFEEVVIDNVSIRSTNEEVVKTKEGELFLKKIEAGDYLILLDDKGKAFSSIEFAANLEGLMNQGIKTICFAVGGAYGFSPEVILRANAKLSLSRMTFSHQIIRVLFAEQLYRAFTIMHHLPYHHE